MRDGSSVGGGGSRPRGGPECKSRDELERLREQVEQRNRRIAELEGQLEEQQKKIGEYQKKVAEDEKKIADVERQLALSRRNSTNSSKPPSSDGLAGPQRPRGCRQRKRKKRRKAGGQKGHPRSEPLPFPNRTQILSTSGRRSVHGKLWSEHDWLRTIRLSHVSGFVPLSLFVEWLPNCGQHQLLWWPNLTH